MPFRIRNCGRIFYGGGAFRSGVQPPTGTILTAPTLDRRPPTAPGPPSTILAPHPFTVRPSRTLLIANKRIQSRTLIKQITSPQMLKQPPTRKSIGSRRIQNTKCPRLIQIQANLPVPFHLHCPSKGPAQILIRIHKLPCPFHAHLLAAFPSRRRTDTFPCSDIPLPIHPTNAVIPCLIQNLPRPASQIHASIRPPVQNLPRFAIHKINASPRPRIKKPFRKQSPANINARRLTIIPRPNIRRIANANIHRLIPPCRRRAVGQGRAFFPVVKQRSITANINARRLTIFRRPHMRRDARALIILIPHRRSRAGDKLLTGAPVEELQKPAANLRAWRFALICCRVINFRRRAVGAVKPVAGRRNKTPRAGATKTPLRVCAFRIIPATIRIHLALIHIPKPNPHANLPPPGRRNRTPAPRHPRAIPRPSRQRPTRIRPRRKSHRSPMQNRPPNPQRNPSRPRRQSPPVPRRKINRRPRQPCHYRNRRIPNQNLPCQNPRTLPCPRVKIRRKTNIALPEPSRPLPTRNIPPLIRRRRKNNRRPSPPPPRQPSKPTPQQRSPPAPQTPDSAASQP